MKNNHIAVRWHLGMGDAIICCGIVRELAKRYDLVAVTAKYNNLVSTAYLFHDLPNVAVRPVIDSEDQDMFIQQVWQGKVLDLTLDRHNTREFDAQFYLKAGLSFQMRWDGFFVRREKGEEVAGEQIPGEPFAFVHEDFSRGYVIIPSRTPEFSHRQFLPAKGISPNLLAYLSVLEQAEQIHCINSSFALLVDSIELPKNPKLYLHLYARKIGELPTFRKDWTRFA